MQRARRHLSSLFAFVAAATTTAGAARADDATVNPKATGALPGAEAASASSSPAAATSVAPPGKVVVHLEGSTAVNLDYRASESAAWEYVCTAPCDVPVTLGGQYRVMGDGLRPSDAFVLDSSRARKGGPVVLDVRPGEQKKYVAGLGILGGGMALVLTGAAVGAAAYLDETSRPPADGQTYTGYQEAMGAATALVVAGAIGTIVGGSFVLRHESTSVDGAVLAPNASRAATSAPPRVAYVSSLPGPSKERTNLPPVFSVPLIRGSF